MSLWDPSQLPSGLLGVWYDATDSATITLNAGNVAQIADKSGNGRHAVQPVAANQPILNASAINGRPAMQSTAADRWLTAAWAAAPITAGGHFLVFRSNSAGFLAQIVNSAGNAFLRNASANFSTQLRGNTIDQVNSPSTARDSNPHVGAFGFGPADVYRAIDGSRLSTARAADSATLDSLALFTNAANPGFNNNLSGLIGEYLFVQGELTLDDQHKIEGYLAWKWGLQANLPANHPWKIGAPDAIEGSVNATLPISAAVNADGVVEGAISAEMAVIGQSQAVQIVEGAIASVLAIIGRAFGGGLTQVRPGQRFVVPPPLSQGALRAGARVLGSLGGYSFTAEPKDPQAVVGYEMDWGQWLAEGETIVAPAKVAASGGVTIAFERIEQGRFVRWRLSGGVDGEDCLVTVTIDTSSGQTDERTIRVPIRER